MARTGKCRKEKLPGKLSIAQSSPGKGKEADTDSALGREDGRVGEQSFAAPAAPQPVSGSHPDNPASFL